MSENRPLVAKNRDMEDITFGDPVSTGTMSTKYRNIETFHVTEEQLENISNTSSVFNVSLSFLMLFIGFFLSVTTQFFVGGKAEGLEKGYYLTAIWGSVLVCSFFAVLLYMNYHSSKKTIQKIMARDE